jgi:hypothetical protein
MKTNRVQVKLVVFPTNKNEWHNNYCSYCPAINYPFGRADSIEKVVADVQSQLLKLLCHREIYKNLQNLGWKITDTSIKVPTFTDEEAVRLTEQSYEIKISNPIIIEIDVEVPLSPTEVLMQLNYISEK